MSDTSELRGVIRDLADAGRSGDLVELHTAALQYMRVAEPARISRLIDRVERLEMALAEIAATDLPLSRIRETAFQALEEKP